MQGAVCNLDTFLDRSRERDIAPLAHLPGLDGPIRHNWGEGGLNRAHFYHQDSTQNEQTSRLHRRRELRHILGEDVTQNIHWVVPEGGGGPNYPNM